MLSRTTSRIASSVIKRNIHIENRIKELGYELPPIPAAPRGNYMLYNRVGNIIYLSGHLPQKLNGELIKGRLGENVGIEEGAVAARTAALQILASVKAEIGDLDKVKKIVRVTGFVNSTNDFTSQPLVINGASDFFGEVFGVDIARHARSAIGVNTLPLGVAVEVEAIFEVKE